MPLERRKLKFERQRLLAERRWKNRELQLRLLELKLKRLELAQVWRNPLAAAVAVGALTLLSNLIVSIIQNGKNEEIAREKNEAELIVEAVKTDSRTGHKNLKFFIDAGFIRDPDKRLSRLIERGDGPSLPPEDAARKAQAAWAPLNPFPDYRVSMELWKKAATEGTGALKARAMAQVGWQYENGFGVDIDCAEALNWYEQAVNNGDQVAKWNIGHVYETGCGSKTDLEAARVWYKKAADAGVPEGVRDYKKLTAASP